jgi:hypothetical protein
MPSLGDVPLGPGRAVRIDRVMSSLVKTSHRWLEGSMQELMACDLRCAVNVGRARLGRSIVKSAGSCVWLFRCECGATLCHAEVKIRLDEFHALSVW